MKTTFDTIDYIEVLPSLSWYPKVGTITFTWIIFYFQIKYRPSLNKKNNG